MSLVSSDMLPRLHASLYSMRVSMHSAMLTAACTTVPHARLKRARARVMRACDLCASNPCLKRRHRTSCTCAYGCEIDGRPYVVPVTPAQGGPDLTCSQ